MIYLEYNLSLHNLFIVHEQIEKEDTEQFLKFMSNTLFFIFILGLLVWTIFQLNNEFKVLIKTDNEQSNNLALPKVEIEKTNPIKDDQAISERLKQIERLEEMIKKQQETIKVLRNN